MSTGFLHQPRLVFPKKVKTEDSSKNCASSAFTLHVLESETLVPPFCPQCGAPGVHSRPIFRKDGVNRLPSLQGHYCDICTQSLEDDSTRRLASALASSIIAVAFATTLTFAWGLRWALLQWFLVLVMGAILPLLGKRLDAWRVARVAVEEVTSAPGSENRRTLRVDNEAFARALAQAALPATQTIRATPSLTEKFQQNWPICLVPALALSWWTLLHFAGVTQVRVLYGGERSATFLIDDRHSGVLGASYSEDPESGQIHRVLGGRRKLALISAEGQVLAEQSATLWPGHTYIMAVLPPGSCLYSETLNYGKEGEGKINLFVPLEGPGPIWEVEGQVDSWFQALAPRTPRGSPSGEETTPGEHVESAEGSLSGGTRRAIRLLPCRP